MIILTTYTKLSIFSLHSYASDRKGNQRSQRRQPSDPAQEEEVLQDQRRPYQEGRQGSQGHHQGRCLLHLRHSEQNPEALPGHGLQVWRRDASHLRHPLGQEQQGIQEGHQGYPEAEHVRGNLQRALQQW